MSIGSITKQLAQEALGNQVKDVMDSFRGGAETPNAPAPDNISAVVMSQVHAMQSVLKDDQELLVSCTAGSTTLRVLEIFAPSPKVVVVTGMDASNSLARVISPADLLQFVCKPAPVKADAKPTRIKLVTPKPKP